MPAVTAGEPTNKEEYDLSCLDNLNVYVSRSLKADHITISYWRWFFGGLNVRVS